MNSTPAMRMHAALLRTGRFVARIAASGAYHTLGQSHLGAAAELAEIASDLNALGYMDPLPVERAERSRGSHAAGTLRLRARQQAVAE